MTRLAVVPIVVVTAVVAMPFLGGDHPVKWDQVEHLAITQVARLPGHPLADRLTPDDPLDEDRWTVPAAPAPSAGPSVGNRPPDLEKHPVNQVTSRWTPGTPQLGVQIYWESNRTDRESTVWAKAQRIVNYVTSLNANSITVSFPFFTPDIKASTVGPGEPTPSPRRIEILAHEATLAGLRVTLRPILDEKSLNPPEGWRGSIAPDSPQAWFDSYRTFLMPYLAVARRQNVATFVVGTELNSLEPHPQWRALVAAAHRVFPGEIVYNLNYDNYGRGLFPAAMDGYGVDAYMKVHAPDSAPPAVITAGWNAFLKKVNRKAPTGIVLSEVGIGARSGAFDSPGDFTSSGTFDARVQPTWYEGVCDVARQRHLAGIYFWKVDFDADPSRPPTNRRPHLDFIGHPASERAIRDCLAAPWPLQS
jgi:hypothetical protein